MADQLPCGSGAPTSKAPSDTPPARAWRLQPYNFNDDGVGNLEDGRVVLITDFETLEGMVMIREDARKLAGALANAGPAPGGRPYRGPIDIGMRFIWEPDLPHARQEIMVIGVMTDADPFNRKIQARALSPNLFPGQGIGNQVWNDEGRFREACVPLEARP